MVTCAVNWIQFCIVSLLHRIWIILNKVQFYIFLEDPGIDGRIILKWTCERLDRGGMDWINLAQDRGRWRAVVNAVMNLRVP
jgi:hypothetical protein